MADLIYVKGIEELRDVLHACTGYLGYLQDALTEYKGFIQYKKDVLGSTRLLYDTIEKLGYEQDAFTDSSSRILSNNLEFIERVVSSQVLLADEYFFQLEKDVQVLRDSKIFFDKYRHFLAEMHAINRELLDLLMQPYAAGGVIERLQEILHIEEGETCRAIDRTAECLDAVKSVRDAISHYYRDV